MQTVPPSRSRKLSIIWEQKQQQPDYFTRGSVKLYTRAVARSSQPNDDEDVVVDDGNGVAIWELNKNLSLMILSFLGLLDFLV